MAVIPVGSRVGRLVTTGPRLDNSPPSRSYYPARCDCGNEGRFRGDVLTRGVTQSCGCLAREGSSVRSRVHGFAGTQLHGLWTNMRYRCNSESAKRYPHYGGRGIKVCSEWDSFARFREWALANGYRKGLSIDRIDVDGDYEPSNCEWVTVAENTRRQHAHYRQLRTRTG